MPIIEVPRGNNLVVIYTRDIFLEEQLLEIKNRVSCIDWNQRYVMVPSEYIERVEFVPR